ncbi:hypothetical protein [Paenibacillus sp. OV219]|uniref:hypothetical protein n=1 Tax=Paenibacillus sp. OV219 TaxID=1884377 RepID=UPI0008BFBE83|nr:hypothetical protein [Paenibacillus sp. OV219]SEO05931.1 hypothetical protein SAMN05518847_105378 [Paenibacillus sp. OV219]
MGLINRMIHLCRTLTYKEEEAVSFEVYLEAANERLREFAVIVSRLESELLSAKDRRQAIEKQQQQFREQAEQAAAQQDAEAAKRYLEQAYTSKTRSDAMLQDIRKLEERIAVTKERFAELTCVIEEASSKHDAIMIRNLLATTEIEANKTIHR